MASANVAEIKQYVGNLAKSQFVLGFICIMACLLNVFIMYYKLLLQMGFLGFAWFNRSKLHYNNIVIKSLILNFFGFAWFKV